MGATSLARAQAPRLQPGRWVRFATDSSDRRIVGRVVSVSRDSITIQRADPSMTDREIAERGNLATSLTSVSDMQIRTASSTHAIEGAIVGTLGGAAVGALAVATSTKPECSGIGGCALESTAVRMGTGLVALVGGVAGGALGALVGAAIETDVWTPAETRATARLELRPAANGLGARLSLSLR